MRPILFAFDRDGTVETSSGPVPLSVLRSLRAEGHKVVAIGNRKLIAEADLPSGHLGNSKPDHLAKLRSAFPDFSRYVLVDDQVIYLEGWEHFTPEQFMSALETFLPAKGPRSR